MPVDPADLTQDRWKTPRKGAGHALAMTPPSRYLGWGGLLAAGLLILAGCDLSAEVPCPDTPEVGTGSEATSPDPGTPYQNPGGSPYAAGPLQTRRFDIARCEQGSPRALRIHAPVNAGNYAVVLFQHGFTASNDLYDDILSHLAGHGFIVVIPQMYTPGNPFIAPSAEVEVDRLEALVLWLEGNLTRITGVTAEMTTLGIAGHSRGGRVAWLYASREPERFLALAGVEPVDGGFPPSPASRLTTDTLSFALPSLIIGAGVESSCSPAGYNHFWFEQISPGPVWHAIALEGGHNDMLDDQETDCELFCDVCEIGLDPAGMRALTGGLLAAFFRATLQGEPDAVVWLTDEASAPTPVVILAR